VIGVRRLLGGTLLVTVFLVPAATAVGVVPGPLAPVATQVDAPTNQAANPAAVLNGVSCSSSNGCLAVGSYVVSGGRTYPLLATTVNGAAPRAVRGPLPAAPGGVTGAELRAVSCPSFGQCLAVGDFTSTSGHTSGYVEGWDQAAQHASLPPTRDDAAANPREVLTGVSCPTSGGCVVVGSYASSTNPSVPLLQRLAVNGHWAAPIALGVPAGAAGSPHGALGAVSCWATGTCELAGIYTDASGAVRPYAQRYAVTGASAAKPVALPADAAANPHATVGAVACPAATWCAVSGTYRTGSGETAFYATRLGAGGTANRVDPPSDAAANPLAVGGALSCVLPGACVLSGGYTDVAHDVAAVTMQLGPSGWGQAARVVAPATASGAFVRLDATSCAPLGRCTFVGATIDGAGHGQAISGAAYVAPGPVTGLLVRQVAGGAVRLGWAPPSADGAGASWYSATAADGKGPAVAVGQTSGRSLVVAGLLAGHRYRFAVTVHADDNQISAVPTAVFATITVASAPRNVAAVPRSRAVVLTWQVPATSYGAPLTGYVVAVNWQGGAEKLTIGVTRTVKVPSLVAGRTYSFTVAATTAAGTGTSSAPVTCTPAS
jgi:Fibronectin type III domain